MAFAKWEFNCPQFVDFEAGLETSVTDIWLDDEKDHQKAIATLSQPFRSRMATPKIKLQKLKKFPVLDLATAVKTDDEKMASMSKLHRRFSKSETCLNRLVETLMTPGVKKQDIAPKLNRKRSLSENNIKKKIHPVTPMCLKRTLKKPPVKGKTSEEIEMDKIAELQNKLKQQLRLNEVNLKRMRSNKAPYPAQRVLNQVNTAKNRIRNAVKDGNPHLQQNDLPNRKPKPSEFRKEQNSKENRSEALRIKSKKLQSVLDSAFKSQAESKVLCVVNGNIKKQPKKKYGEYCGLSFFPNQEKTVPQPFSFDTSSVSSQNASFCLKDIRKIKSEAGTPSLAKNFFSEKENIF